MDKYISVNIYVSISKNRKKLKLTWNKKKSTILLDINIYKLQEFKGETIMKEKVFKLIIAWLLIFMMVMSNSIAVFANLITYAADEINGDISTNHKNVEFSVYFKGTDGKKYKSIDEQISNDNIKMGIEIEVKQEGYFNGEITLDSSNFTLKSEKTSDEINKIEGNKITLNQINAGSKVSLEIGITPIRDEQYDLDLLKKESKISIGRNI